MQLVTDSFSIKTNPGLHIVDITEQLREFAVNNQMKIGQLTVFVRHTTAGLRINENESCLLEDMQEFFDLLASRHKKYHHDNHDKRICPPEEPVNGHAHLQAMVLNSSETIPILDGRLTLGQWQSVFLIDLDGGRTREILMQIVGNSPHNS